MKIRWFRNEYGRFRFQGLTREQEEHLLRELGPYNPELRERLIRRLEMALDEYEIGCRFMKAWGTSKLDRKRAQKAAKALKEASAAVRDLGPQVWWDNDDEYEGDPIPLSELPGALDYWHEMIIGYADGVEVTAGRPSQKHLDEAIYYLAFIYKAATGCPPGYSSSPVSKPGSTAKDTHGPFVRFCKSVISVVTPTATSTIENAVRKVLHQGKNADPDWLNFSPEDL